MFSKKSKSIPFFQSTYAVDAVVSQQLLQKKGYPSTSLDCPILYRGDNRAPDIIFKEGFQRRHLNKIPFITGFGESKNGIACTKQFVYALGFADCANNHWYTTASAFSWVYVLRAKKGIDLATMAQHGAKINYAKWVDEVVLTHVPKDDIIAALQISVTGNTICCYYQKEFSTSSKAADTAWQIRITDFRINPYFEADEQPSLSVEVIEQFNALHRTGYYRIPWSPYPEETDLQKMNVNTLMPFQQQVFANGYVHSVEEAKKIRTSYEASGLKAGFSLEMVLADKIIFDEKIIAMAQQSNVSLDLLGQVRLAQAYGLLNKLPYDVVKDVSCYEKIDALLLGFTLDDIKQYWWFNGRAGRMFFDVAEQRKTLKDVKIEIARKGYYMG